jgi:hypothetical protein
MNALESFGEGNNMNKIKILSKIRTRSERVPNMFGFC